MDYIPNPALDEFAYAKELTARQKLLDEALFNYVCQDDIDGVLEITTDPVFLARKTIGDRIDFMANIRKMLAPALACDDAEILRTLIQFCKKYNIRYHADSMGNYLLVRAASCLKADHVDVLLDEGFDPNMIGQFFFRSGTALHSLFHNLHLTDAQIRNCQRIAKSLIAANANLDLKVRGRSIIKMAKCYPNHPVSQVIFDHLHVEPRRNLFGTQLQPRTAEIVVLRPA